MPTIKTVAFLIGTALALSTVATRPVADSVNTDVATYHNDNARTGQNLQETVLTPGNVNMTTFGKLGFLPVDGKVDAQPLYLSGVSIPGQGTHNILYVATEHDSVYAFDADTNAVLWQVSLLGPNETTSDARRCDGVTPEIGITSTPVIDRTVDPSGAMYVVAMSMDGSGNYFQRLHALTVTTGAELFGGPRNIQASFPGTGDGSVGGVLIFDPSQYKERSALLLVGGMVITTWASHCDSEPYTGWIIAYDASTLTQRSVLNVTPNGIEGGIWMSAGGPAADSAGNIYLLDGNGTFDTTLDVNGFPSLGDFGNAFLKLSTSAGLNVADYFATYNTVSESSQDLDLGSGGALVLPDLIDGSGHVLHLTVGAGKNTHIYVADRDAMGKWNPAANSIYQEIVGALADSVFSSPAYFDNTVYFQPVQDSIKAFSISNALLSSTPTARTTHVFAYPGTTPGISANGNASAILWAIDGTDPGVLYAYDARNLSRELYNSSQAPAGRDVFGPGNKFTTPTIANGRVYVGTTNGVAAFGLLAQVAPTITTQPVNLTMRVGQNAAFSIAASGTPAPTDRWQISTNGGSVWANLSNAPPYSGVTTTTLTITGASLGLSGYQYRAVATNTVGTATSRAATLTVLSTPGDFDGDGKTDIVVYRPSNSAWYILQSSTNFTGSVSYLWGQSSDIPVQGDFDGDGQADVVMYRPSTGAWYILLSSTSYTTFVSYIWGLPGDIPLAGELDGDGKADLVVYRPSSGAWYILQSSTSYTTFVSYIWGLPGDIPVPADYDGDGATDIAVYRPSNGLWYILQSSTSYTGFVSYIWGLPGDIPVPGDYDGDGKADLVVYRPSSGAWYILQSSTGYTAFVSYIWGLPGDVLVPGDYDGDGTTDIAVYRPSSGAWYILQSSTSFTTFVSYIWGLPGDIPVLERQ